MSALCSCTSSYNNTGLPNCIGELIKDSQKLIMVSRYNNAGTLNKISLPATLNAAYFTALTTNPARNVQLKGEIYTCDLAGGNEVLLRTSTLSNFKSC